MIVNFLMYFSGWFLAIGLILICIGIFAESGAGRLVFSRATAAIITLIAVILMWIGLFFTGADWQKNKAAVALKEQAAKLEVADRLYKELDEKYNTLQTEKNKERVIIKTQVVTKWIPAKADENCTVNNGFVRVHNGAATSTPLTEPEPSDAEPSNVKLSQVGQVVQENYTSCNDLADRYKSLLEWYKSVKVIHDTALK